MAPGKTNRKIGIFGGTFDPVHYGHLTIGQLALEVCQLDAFYFVPAGNPPHKSLDHVSDVTHRYEMLKMAISSHPQFNICDYELKRATPSFTLHLLEYFKEQYPEDELYLVMGADSFRELESWYHYNELFHLAHVVVMNREGSDPCALNEKAESFQRQFHATITLVTGMKLDVSSSMIRKRLEDCQSIRYMTPDDVILYIQGKQLYQKQVNTLE